MFNVLMIIENQCISLYICLKTSLHKIMISKNNLCAIYIRYSSAVHVIINIYLISKNAYPE